MGLKREEAWKLLEEWVSSESLRRHMLAVEAAMRAYARKYDEDEELWGIAGLLHDLDYERYPMPDTTAKSGHPFEAVKVLEAKCYPPEIIQAILGHATYTGVPRETLLAKCLFACDELCGFITAIGWIRPERLVGLTPAKVKKYLKNKRFAEKVSREEIARGIAELGIPEEEHIALVIQAMQGIAKQLGF
jgi:putative nucleotidyltransferase with HDIG domain